MSVMTIVCSEQIWRVLLQKDAAFATVIDRFMVWWTVLTATRTRAASSDRSIHGVVGCVEGDKNQGRIIWNDRGTGETIKWSEVIRVEKACLTTSPCGCDTLHCVIWVNHGFSDPSEVLSSLHGGGGGTTKQILVKQTLPLGREAPRCYG